MKTLPFVMIILSACGDNLGDPIPPAPPLPSCADLGCGPTQVDKHCAATGECACGGSKDLTVPPTACAAECDHLPCEALACDLEDVSACTCVIGTIYASCRG